MLLDLLFFDDNLFSPLKKSIDHTCEFLFLIVLLASDVKCYVLFHFVILLWLILWYCYDYLLLFSVILIVFYHGFTVDAFRAFPPQFESSIDPGSVEGMQVFKSLFIFNFIMIVDYTVFPPSNCTSINALVVRNCFSLVSMKQFHALSDCESLIGFKESIIGWNWVYLNPWTHHDPYEFQLLYLKKCVGIGLIRWVIHLSQVEPRFLWLIWWVKW